MVQDVHLLRVLRLTQVRVLELLYQHRTLLCAFAAVSTDVVININNNPLWDMRVFVHCDLQILLEHHLSFAIAIYLVEFTKQLLRLKYRKGELLVPKINGDTVVHIGETQAAFLELFLMQRLSDVS